LSLLFDPGATSLSKIEAAMEQEGYSVDQIVISLLVRREIWIVWNLCLVWAALKIWHL
jgi:hypothetical protein